MQAHYGMGHPGFDEFEESLLAFSGTGVDVHITELDVTVLPTPDRRVGAEVSASFEYQEKMNPYAKGLPEKESAALNDRYLDFFKLFLKHGDKIKRVTTWGISDIHSWKNNWPIRGRTNYPLLFDRNYQAKPVVEDIIKATKQ
jgi:endo-1,4-beta-xylanase